MKNCFAAVCVFASAVMSSSAQADCLSDIQDIMKGLESNGAYRIEMVMDSAGTKSIMTGEIIMPHSMRMKSDSMEMVMTPNGVWMGDGGTLQKMPAEMKDQIQAMIKQGMNLGLSSIAEPACEGDAEFEGESYNLFKYRSEVEFMGINSKSFVAMYVDDDNRPVWMVIDGEAMGIKSLTRQKITYDDSITIADPQ